MQQNPPHCEAPPDAAAVAQQGPLVVRQSHTVRRARRLRGGLRGHQLQALRGARDVPEPPRLQEAPGPGRGRVRLRQPRPTRNSMRRVALRGGPPVHLAVRVR